MTESGTQTYSAPAFASTAELSTLVIMLLKGVIYRENDLKLWSSLIKLQARVRDYVSTLCLELNLDEVEGYAFLSTKSTGEQDDAVPRLMVRRQLSFPVSLILALLRKRLAEFDARGGDTRLVLSREDILELVRVFLPERSNETKLINHVEAQLNKIIELGFLKKLKEQYAGDHRYEVRRILKAFVDAQWLSEFDLRLRQYATHAAGGTTEAGDE
jgi:hypothetical protein